LRPLFGHEIAASENQLFGSFYDLALEGGSFTAADMESAY